MDRQIFESCDDSVQCNGTENATVCKDHGDKRLCYCDHGYLEVNGVCLLGHNEYFSALLLSMVNTNFFFKSIKPIKIIIVTN